MHIAVHARLLLQFPETENMPPSNPLKACNCLFVSPAALHCEFFADSSRPITDETSRVAQSFPSCRWTRSIRGLSRQDHRKQVIQCALRSSLMSWKSALLREGAHDESSRRPEVRWEDGRISMTSSSIRPRVRSYRPIRVHPSTRALGS